MSTTLPIEHRQNPVLRRILLAGAAVAVLDISYAYVYFVKILGVLHSLEGVFQSIAAGLLGRASYEGGLRTAALGAVLHVLIAYTWTLAFYLAVRAWGGLRRAVRTPAGAAAVGIVLGMFMWTFMDLVVLRLSRARSLPPSNPRFWINFAQHALMLGPAIALIVRDGEG